jgi:putative Flp pilus-assembly TadE/G-like protein
VRNVVSPSGSERGMVTVTFAIALPVLLLFVSLVINVGHWFTHHRHLQLQADAGALAGGDLFNRCFETTDPVAANAAIRGEARKFAGDPTVTPRYNSQVSIRKTENVVVLINSKTYDRGGPGPDDTDERDPCLSAMVDVKLSDEDVPWFMRLATVDAINARARVAAKVVSSLVGSLPIAVPDPVPRLASVSFVDETSGSVLATQALTGPTVTGGVANFTMSGAVPITVTAGQRIGIRVNLGGETSTTCGDAFVQCYGVGAGNGLAFIRGYAAGSGPQSARAVWPTSGACTNAVGRPGAEFFYDVPYTASCSVGLSADLNLGVSSLPAGPNVTAHFVGSGVTVNKAMSLSGGIWHTTSDASLSAQTGPINVSIEWEQNSGTLNGATCRNGGANPPACHGTFANVQRVFSAKRDLSGPIKVVSISEPGSTATGSPLALAAGDHNLQVAVATSYFAIADLANRSTDETYGLRVADPSGSQNQAFDCDVGVNFRDEIINGCLTPYQPNPNHPGCPETTPPTPEDCMDVETGDKIGQLEGGLDQRLGNGGSCTINNWPNVPEGDPRAIPLIITQFAAFTGNGGSINSQVPVRRFGYFYVTGWSRSNCPTNEPYPWSSNKQDSKGDIWGHFIHHVITFNGGGAGNASCVLDASDPLDLNPCIAVMTR